MNGSFPEEGRVGNGAREKPVMQKKGDRFIYFSKK